MNLFYNLEYIIGQQKCFLELPMVTPPPPGIVSLQGLKPGPVWVRQGLLTVCDLQQLIPNFSPLLDVTIFPFFWLCFSMQILENLLHHIY